MAGARPSPRARGPRRTEVQLADVDEACHDFGVGGVASQVGLVGGGGDLVEEGALLDRRLELPLERELDDVDVALAPARAERGLEGGEGELARGDARLAQQP